MYNNEQIIKKNAVIAKPQNRKPGDGNNNLPDFRRFADSWGNLPELSPELIPLILRQNHKMMLAGPSKAGKSFALIELAIAIVEGREWLGRKCMKGNVLYINLEIDDRSLAHRIADIYMALGIEPQGVLDVWGLRGKSVPMDKLTPILIRRIKEKEYSVIILDPIYKVLTGDENSASDMARFCNEFDKLCRDLGCSTIICHHHSKGNQISKRSVDRASGSGVFARDADALLDMIQLHVSDDLRNERASELVAEMYCKKLDERFGNLWRNDTIDCHSEIEMRELYYHYLPDEISAEEEATAIRERAQYFTAWRIEGTLREFPPYGHINVWFQYPIHVIDDRLAGCSTEDGLKRTEKATKKSKEKATAARTNKFDKLKAILTMCSHDEDGGIPIADAMAMCKGDKKLDVKRDTFIHWFSRHEELKEYHIRNGKIYCD